MSARELDPDTEEFRYAVNIAAYWGSEAGQEERRRMQAPTPYYDRDGITIYCGDCRDVLPHLEPDSVDLVLTDPPYGDDHDTDYRRFSGGRRYGNGDELPRYQYPPVTGDRGPFDPRHLLGLTTHIVMFGANRFSDKLPTGSWLIWDKRTYEGNKGVMSDAEIAWYSQGRGVYIYAHTWDGFNRATEARTKFHPTQKPVALMRWCILRTKSSGCIIDPYMGSGPVLLASRDLGRRAIGIEIEERYCEIAVKRLQQSVLPMAVTP